MERAKCRLAKAPQGYYLKDIYGAHQKALAENIHDKIDSATMMSDYGYSLYTVEADRRILNHNSGRLLYFQSIDRCQRELTDIWNITDWGYYGLYFAGRYRIYCAVRYG